MGWCSLFLQVKVFLDQPAVWGSSRSIPLAVLEASRLDEAALPANDVRS
jgi:hypothetical protein